MKYSQKYPNAEPLQMVDATIMCGRKIDNCAQCGALTKFIDVDFETHICSEECEEAFTEEFFKRAMKR